MRYIIIILSVILFQSLKASELAIDNHLSKVIWRANKSTGSFHNGFIELADGHITIENNKVINGSIIIDMNSISCYDILNEQSNQSLVSHLKSDDFFSVEAFPKATLNLLEVIKLNNDATSNHLIKGNLEILNVTHPVEFLASINMYSNGAKAEGVIPIDRAKYGIKYKSKTWYENLGDHFIDDIFYIYFHVIALDN